jgi:hypothetical protein
LRRVDFELACVEAKTGLPIELLSREDLGDVEISLKSWSSLKGS